MNLEVVSSDEDEASDEIFYSFLSSVLNDMATDVVASPDRLRDEVLALQNESIFPLLAFVINCWISRDFIFRFVLIDKFDLIAWHLHHPGGKVAYIYSALASYMI